MESEGVLERREGLVGRGGGFNTTILLSALGNSIGSNKNTARHQMSHKYENTGD